MKYIPTYETNDAFISGTVAEIPVFSHEIHGEEFYRFKIASQRLSEKKDILPVLISSRLCRINSLAVGENITIRGNFRSYNQYQETQNKLLLYIHAQEISKNECEISQNSIMLDGYVCKPTVYRKTPLGREIADVLLAVNRNNGKSDYIPCVAWGRNARFLETLPVATQLKLEGRLQSRTYIKKLSEAESEERVAYEVSISKMFVQKKE